MRSSKCSIFAKRWKRSGWLLDIYLIDENSEMDWCWYEERGFLKWWGTCETTKHGYMQMRKNKIMVEKKGLEKRWMGWLIMLGGAFARYWGYDFLHKNIWMIINKKVCLILEKFDSWLKVEIPNNHTERSSTYFGSIPILYSIFIIPTK